MPAIVDIVEKNGVSGDPTIKTAGTVRFKRADNPTVDLVDPMVVPQSGDSYSMEKVLRLAIGAQGPSAQITNLRAYMDGAIGFGAGVKLWFRTSVSYEQPAIPGNLLAFTDAETLTVAAPLNLGDGPYTQANAEIGLHLVLVLSVDNTAVQGITPSEALTFSYDEI